MKYKAKIILVLGIGIMKCWNRATILHFGQSNDPKDVQIKSLHTFLKMEEEYKFEKFCCFLSKI